jgi:hypothetical protein
MSWTDPIPADSNWWEFVPVFDGKQQKQESVLRKYVNDWGYGVVAGNVMKRSKHPHCSWAVKHALDEWDDVFSSKGTPPLKPLSKQELEHIEGHSTNAAAAVDEERVGGTEPDSLNVSAIEQVNESSSRARTTARQVLAKGFSPTVAEGLSHARGRDSLGHDPTGRLSYGGIRRETVGGGGGGGTPDPISAEGAWQPSGEQVGLYTTRANKVYPVYREPDGKLYYPNYYGKKQETDQRHVAPLENEWGDADEIVGSYKVSFGVDKDEVVAVYKEKSTGKVYRFEGKHGGKRVEVKKYNPPEAYARP